MHLNDAMYRLAHAHTYAPTPANGSCCKPALDRTCNCSVEMFIAAEGLFDVCYQAQMMQLLPALDALTCNQSLWLSLPALRLVWVESVRQIIPTLT